MSVLEQVIKIVAKQLDKDPSEFDETTDLEAAGFESLDVIEMVFNLEDEFKIDIPFNANESEVRQMRTVGDIVKLIEEIKATGAVTTIKAMRPPSPTSPDSPDSPSSPAT